MIRKTVTSPHAPAAVGPYSQAVVAGNLLFVSGQIGIDPASGTLVNGGIAEETHRVLKNIRAICEAAGTDLKNVLKTTLYLTDLSHFKTVNDIYAGYFNEHPPARSTVGVSSLPLGAMIEIDAMACLP